MNNLRQISLGVGKTKSTSSVKRWASKSGALNLSRETHLRFLAHRRVGKMVDIKEDAILIPALIIPTFRSQVMQDVPL